MSYLTVKLLLKTWHLPFLTQVKALWVPSIFSKTITSLCFLSQRFHQTDAVWTWAGQLTSFTFILSSLNEDDNTYHKGMGQNGMTLQRMDVPATCYIDAGRYSYLGSHFPLITLSCSMCQALTPHCGCWCISFQLLPWQITINVVAWVCYVTALRVRSPKWASLTKIKVSGGWHLWRLWGNPSPYRPASKDSFFLWPLLIFNASDDGWVLLVSTVPTSAPVTPCSFPCDCTELTQVIPSQGPYLKYACEVPFAM